MVSGRGVETDPEKIRPGACVDEDKGKERDWTVGSCWIRRFITTIRVNTFSANQNASILCRVLRFGTWQRLFFLIFFVSLLLYLGNFI